jgi:hypothetical protein
MQRERHAVDTVTTLAGDDDDPAGEPVECLIGH